MGATSFLRNLLDTLGFGSIAAPGTWRLPTGEEDYPAFIANEGAGGMHTYESLEDMAAAKPATLVLGMQASVQAHDRPDGSKHSHTTYLLIQMPSQRILDIPNYNISLYWEAVRVNNTSVVNTSQSIRYAPNVDPKTGEANVNGGKPIYPQAPQGSGRRITQTEYNALSIGNTVNLSSQNLNTGTFTPVTGYWSSTLDPLIHFWYSFQLSDGNWSAPMAIGSEEAEVNDYTATLYQWSATKPLQPARYIGGQLNNDPQGWTDKIPLPRPSLVHKLWATKAKKNVSFQLKSDWFPPYEIPLDPALVRFSEKRTPDPNTINDGVFDEAAFNVAGWESMISDIHKFMAIRVNTQASWYVEIMANESGAYPDTVYKNFKLSQQDDVMNPETAHIYRPKGRNPAGWSDVPPVAGSDEVTMQSTADKYFNGYLINDWSNPVPAHGQDVLFDYITSEGGSQFHTNTDNTTVPNAIKLIAHLYRGKTVLTENITYAWHCLFNDGSFLEALVGTGKELNLTPADVNGQAVYRCRQVYQEIVFTSEFTVQDITDGQDAQVLMIQGNSNLLVQKLDNSYQPAEIKLRAWSQNLSDGNALTWFKNNVQVKDSNDVAFQGNLLLVDYTDFTGMEEITYRAVSADGLFDEYTISKVNQGTGIDAITMVLSNEMHAVVFDAATNTTNFTTAKSRIQVFQGLDDVTGAWWTSGMVKTDLNVTSELKLTNGIVTLQVIDMAAGVTSGSVTISATREGKTLTKVFSISRITNPTGAVFTVVESDESGFVFSPASATSKALTAKLLVNGQELIADNMAYAWYIGTSVTPAFTTKTVNINRNQVSFSLQLRAVITHQGKNYGYVVPLTDVRDAFKKGVLYTSQEKDDNNNPISSNDVPPSSVSWDTANTQVGSVFWTNSREGAVYEIIREEYAAGWSDPVRISGEKGEPGDDGISTRMGKIYRWSVSQPAAVAEPMNIDQPDWLTEPGTAPSPNHLLWVCTGDITLTNTPVLIPPGWSEPFPFGGPRGATGIGQTGSAATISPGIVTILPAGSNPTVENAGDAQNAVFNFGIPGAPAGKAGGGLVYLHESAIVTVQIGNDNVVYSNMGMGYKPDRVINASNSVLLRELVVGNPNDENRWFRIYGGVGVSSDDGATDDFILNFRVNGISWSSLSRRAMNWRNLNLTGESLEIENYFRLRPNQEITVGLYLSIRQGNGYHTDGNIFAHIV